jgi:uncharacterized membrane protein YkoI
VKRRTSLVVAGAIAAVAIAVGSGIAVAAGDDDSEGPITGRALDRASEAALAHVGEGRVTETEVGDEESYYEVEVRRDDGSQVDVQLDEDFEVVGQKVDDDRTEGGDDD